MSSVNKFLSKLNQATTAIKSVKGISSKIFGTGYQTDLSKEREDVEDERQRLLSRAKKLKNKGTSLVGIPLETEKMLPKLPATELIYPRDEVIDTYLEFKILPRKKRPTSKNLLNEGDTFIYLYAPALVSNSPSLSYSNIDFGNVQRGVIAGDGLFTGKTFEGLSAELREMLSKTMNTLQLNTKNFRDDRTFNPQKEVMFEGIEYRTFDMSFQFKPNSAEEAIEVQDIIWCFRTAMLPDTYQQAGDKGFEGVAGDAKEFSENFFNLPNQVEIRYFNPKNPEGKTQMEGFLRSFITACNVTYNGGQKMETFIDGQPLVIDMQLSFVENILMTQENYQHISASSRRDTSLRKTKSARDSAQAEGTVASGTTGSHTSDGPSGSHRGGG